MYWNKLILIETQGVPVNVAIVTIRVSWHGLNFHSYTDDIQIYFTVKPNSACPPASCLLELKTWMYDNLQLNTGKTEILLIGPKP